MYFCRKAKRCYEKAFALDSDCEETGAALVDTLNLFGDQVGIPNQPHSLCILRMTSNNQLELRGHKGKKYSESFL